MFGNVYIQLKVTRFMNCRSVDVVRAGLLFNGRVLSTLNFAFPEQHSCHVSCIASPTIVCSSGVLTATVSFWYWRRRCLQRWWSTEPLRPTGRRSFPTCGIQRWADTKPDAATATKRVRGRWISTDLQAKDDVSDGLLLLLDLELGTPCITVFM